MMQLQINLVGATEEKSEQPKYFEESKASASGSCSPRAGQGH